MADVVNVAEVIDVVATTEVVDLVMPVINETTITGEGQTDTVSVVESDTDTATLSEVSQTVSVQEVIEVVTPQFSEVLVQVVEDSSMPYAKRVDFIDDDNFYKAEAIPGTLDTEAGWRISKVSIAPDGDSITLWAGGNASFNKVWGDHLTEVYT